MKRALQTLYANPQFWTSVAVGGALTWLSTQFSLLFFLLALPLGYGISVMRSALHNRDELPAWSEFGEHLVNGIFVLILSMVFFLPAGFLGALAYVPALQGTAVANFLARFLWLGFLLFSAFGFGLLLMGMARYAAIGRFTAAFQVPEALKQIAECLNEYVVLVALCAVSSTALQVFAGSLNRILPFGIVWIAAGAAGFVLWLVCCHATGSLYATHFGSGPSVEAAPKPPAVAAPPAPKAALPSAPQEEESFQRIRGEEDWA